VPEESAGPPPHEPGPHWGEVGIHGLHRPRRWDAVAVLDADSLEGDEATFVALADGTYVVERGDPAFDPTLLARGLELEPPYRAEAVRRSGSTWAAGARAIVVVEMSRLASGDELQIVFDGTERSVLVDGSPTLASVPELEELAAARFDTWVVRAARLRDVLWEVEVGSL
jgi:hypothetical protein